MKRLSIVAVLLASSVFAADRVVTYLASRVKMDAVHLQSLPDGGCAVDVCMAAETADGSRRDPSCTGTVELSGTAQTRCLSLFNSAETLWRNQTGYTQP